MSVTPIPYKGGMERTLTIEVRCEHCGLDSGKPVSRFQDGTRVWVPPIFLEMDGSPVPRGRDELRTTAPWYLCVACWLSGVNVRASAIAVVEPAPAA